MIETPTLTPIKWIEFHTNLGSTVLSKINETWIVGYISQSQHKVRGVCIMYDGCEWYECEVENVHLIS